jgi:hypothetical protein
LPGASLSKPQKAGLLDEVKVLMSAAGLEKGGGKRPDRTEIAEAENDLQKTLSSGKFKLNTQEQLQLDLENFKAAAD